MLDARKQAIDVAAFEAWLGRVPQTVRVKDWRVQGVDAWPLLNTCLVSLAILMRIRQRKSLFEVGGGGWKAAILLDYMAASPCRWAVGATQPRPLPEDDLADCVLYCGSKVHGRQLGEVTLTAPLDVPATLMRQAGHRGVFWFEDVEATDSRLELSLNQPARGVFSILRAARNRAWQFSVARDLDSLPGFLQWCAEAAGFMRLVPRFLRTWLARQLELALSASQCFGEVFDAKGHPRLLVLLNGGFASTVGMTVAAKSRRIPVVEVQHGADSECAVTSPNATPHFSSYNSAPDGLISWEIRPRADEAVLSVGPIGLHLPAVIETPHASDASGHRTLRAAFDAQRRDLADKALALGATAEVLVSLQPGDQGEWIESIAQAVGPGVLFWVRRHGSDLSCGLSPLPLEDKGLFEVALASSSALPQLLLRVGAHLTRFSAVSLEAAAMGVPTFAVEAYAQQLYARSISPDLLIVETDLDRMASRLKASIEQATGRRQVPLQVESRIVPFLEKHLHRASIGATGPH